ncbi:hypothetical protein, partial [Pandoraea anhela]|uniref:hypothetical protein n=1 Tax=Pandoraea anhela TaxID=2508295 RepID=UPI001C2DAA59
MKLSYRPAGTINRLPPSGASAHRRIGASVESVGAKRRYKSRAQSKNPLQLRLQGVFKGSLTITYFHTG